MEEKTDFGPYSIISTTAFGGVIEHKSFRAMLGSMLGPDYIEDQNLQNTSCNPVRIAKIRSDLYKYGIRQLTISYQDGVEMLELTA